MQVAKLVFLIEIELHLKVYNLILDAARQSLLKAYESKTSVRNIQIKLRNQASEYRKLRKEKIDKVTKQRLTATGKIINHFPNSNQDDISNAVNSAKKAFSSWRRVLLNFHIYL